MSIKAFSIIQNNNLPKFNKVKEKFDIFIPGIIDGIPNRNGFIWIISGAPGSGKTNLLLNMFKKKELYRFKFHNIFYISPMSSFSSVEKHPFAEHDKIYHELNEDILDNISNQLEAIKQESIENEDIQYNCVIIDDFADILKDNDISNKLKSMLIKSRHLNCSFIFTLQSFLLFPKQLRKLLFNITIFKPQNKQEFQTLCDEIINLKKENALKLETFIFDEEYNHLDIDLKTNQLYKNFHKIILDYN
jgi:hypothetical protein